MIYKDLLILGGRVSERTPASPGDERAYDVRTGQLRWSFHTIPAAGEPGCRNLAPNRRARESGRRERVGGHRSSTPSVASSSSPPVRRPTISTASIGPATICTRNCVIALDANTGKKLWHFQATRHDLWDSDFAAPPILLTVNSNGRRVDAVAATNKFGLHLHLRPRHRRIRCFRSTEMKVPTSTVPGEVTSPTQPVPTLPAPLAKLTMTRDEVTNRTPEMRAWAQKEFDTFLGTEPDSSHR